MILGCFLALGQRLCHICPKLSACLSKNCLFRSSILILLAVPLLEEMTEGISPHLPKKSNKSEFFALLLNYYSG